MRTIVMACLAVCVAFAAGCKKNSAQLAAQVKSEMQQDYSKRKGLEHLVVEDVRLVKQPGDSIEYLGEATASIDGERLKFSVVCKYDGTSVLWKAELSEGSFAEIAAKKMARETYQQLAEMLPKVKTSIKQKCDAVAKSIEENLDAAKKSVSSFYDRAKEKTSELLEGASKGINAGVDTPASSPAPAASSAPAAPGASEKPAAPASK